MSEEKSLIQILQELVDHAKNTSGQQQVELKLALPQSTVKQFSLGFSPIERAGGPYNYLDSGVKKVFLAGGTVEFV